MMHPLTIFILLLVGAGASLLLARLRPRYAPPAAIVAATVVTLSWLLARPQLPLTYSVSPWPAALSLPAWTWRVDAFAWELSLGVLILVTAVTFYRRKGEQPLLLAGLSVPPGALALLFGAAGLVALWADSLPGLLTGWTLLSVVFFAALFTSPALRERPSALWSRLGAGWMSLFFLWLAAATFPQTAVGLDMRGWPVLTRSLLLIAALFQIGIFPFHWWRPPAAALSSGVAALAHTVPAAAGALLWARLEANSDIGLAFALPLTLLGLLGLFAAAYRAWSRPDTPRRVAAVLVLGQASFILLAGMWAGPDAVVAEGRVLLLAGGLLLLAAPALKEAAPLFRLGPLIAALAMAGIPLTAGFTGRALLYGAWQDEGRWILILTTVILHLPLAAAALMLVLEDVQDQFEGSLALPELASAAHTLVPVLGLPAVAALAGAPLLSWPAVLLPIAAGAALTRYTEEAYQVQRLLRAALTPNVPATGAIGSAVRTAGRSLSQAIRQAAAVVEGENGVLWLLLLLVIVWLAR
ncbi:MAG: hypothetical protein R3248_11105 [Candidatus Promineifilaceae bacterium]|nr:hypothetical protein [Candidatus Promineifilaceae bacterium]